MLQGYLSKTLRIRCALKKRIAIIGSGISGLVSANLLSQEHDITLFEANHCLGGHTHTHNVNIARKSYAIDTGFIVFNKKTYPLFCKLLDKYNIPIQLSEMSFSYRSDKKNLEYNGHNLNTLFADRRNLLKPQFYRFIAEILRFNKDAKKFLTIPSNANITIQHFTQQQRYSTHFIEDYLVPMMASIWSKTHHEIMACSAQFVLQFYANHGLLDTYDRPAWYVIANGSSSYIPVLTNSFKHQIALNTKIISIERQQNQVVLKSATQQFIFDAVVIATHSDQALEMLTDPSDDEKNILSGIPYRENEVILHTDIRLLPKHPLAWASWNYLDNDTPFPTLTYYMNRLQSIESPYHFCVSLNLSEQIDESKIIKRFQYAHPCFNLQTHSIQQQKRLINGKNNTYFAGSYWGYGFHEDGVKSAIDVCELLGVTL